jgi:hypothetical protein
MNRLTLERLLRRHAPEVIHTGVYCGCGYFYDAADAGLTLEKWSKHVADAIYPRTH